MPKHSKKCKTKGKDPKCPMCKIYAVEGLPTKEDIKFHEFLEDVLFNIPRDNK